LSGNEKERMIDNAKIMLKEQGYDIYENPQLSQSE
jgi:hypothetical protein